MQDLVSFANHLADESGKVIRGYFRQPFDVETKSDESPVTAADKGAEARLREIIEAQRPEDGILGEEYGPKESRNGYTWVLDPIDGTKSFVIGRPTFGTLIALCKDGVPILGVIDQPILNERWVGDGKVTYFNGQEAHTRKCPSLKQARVASTAPAQLAAPNADGHLWQALDAACAYTVWGGDCYSYGLLANGGLDAVVETCLAPYDYLALVPVVTGAGGFMSDWNGNPLTLINHDKSGRTIAMGDASLKDDFLKIING
ncbi:MAG: histidinol phosphate phosphatase [Micavibrio aeruginosavorus]|uniref:Histidinol phosphate phosphatase n=1 Tax=Micavibrio aeruginosavorus TaxID=349221 RepID=A0A2W5BIV7_9BACT|nr:MAG: histidinol phosphate phosphatase [Micavibrio aeruginosavorus]